MTYEYKFLEEHLDYITDRVNHYSQFGWKVIHFSVIGDSYKVLMERARKEDA